MPDSSVDLSASLVDGSSFSAPNLQGNASNKEYEKLNSAIVAHNSKEVARLLREKKDSELKLLSKNNENLTPLMLAAQVGDLKVVKLLVNFLQSKSIYAPRSYGILIKEILSSLWYYLIGRPNPNENINDLSRDDEWISASLKIQEDFDAAFLVAAENGCSKNLNFLLTVVEPNVKNGQGDTALSLATKNNHLEIVKILLNTKKPLKHKKIKDAFLLSVVEKHPDITKVFLKTKKFTAFEKAEAFCSAVNINNVGAIKLFLEAGIDFKAKDEQGNSPLSQAIKNKNKEAIDLFIKESPGLKDELFILAVQEGDLEFVKELKGNPSAKDEHGNSALLLAANKENKPVVIWLLENLLVHRKEAPTYYEIMAVTALLPFSEEYSVSEELKAHLEWFKKIRNIRIPESLVCFINGSLMIKPIATSDGRTYEEGIIGDFSNNVGQIISPFSRAELNKEKYPNLKIQQFINFVLTKFNAKIQKFFNEALEIKSPVGLDNSQLTSQNYTREISFSYLDKDLNCPLTNEEIKVPVIAPNGCTYEQKNLVCYLENFLAPFIMREILNQPIYYFNYAFKDLIDEINSKKAKTVIESKGDFVKIAEVAATEEQKKTFSLSAPISKGFTFFLLNEYAKEQQKLQHQPVLKQKDLQALQDKANEGNADAADSLPFYLQ